MVVVYLRGTEYYISYLYFYIKYGKSFMHCLININCFLFVVALIVQSNSV